MAGKRAAKVNGVVKANVADDGNIMFDLLEREEEKSEDDALMSKFENDVYSLYEKSEGEAQQGGGAIGGVFKRLKDKLTKKRKKLT